MELSIHQSYRRMSLSEEGAAIIRTQHAADQLQAMITTIVNSLDDCETVLGAGFHGPGPNNPSLDHPTKPALQECARRHRKRPGVTQAGRPPVSVTREITLWCDQEGCSEWIGLNNYESNGGNVAAARISARRGRWTNVGDKDFCKQHSTFVAKIIPVPLFDGPSISVRFQVAAEYQHQNVSASWRVQGVTLLDI